MEQPQKLYIGIDTGVHTGFSVWNKTHQIFDYIDCLMIHQAMIFVLELWNNKDKQIIQVRVEDARLRSGKMNPAIMQGVGAVKMHAKIWEDFLKDYQIPFEMVKPTSRTFTKLSDEQFKRMTKCKFRTNEHSRDSSMLVFGR